MSYQSAANDWKAEVEAEADRLIIQRGVPPWDAIQQARDIISNRRRQQANKVAEPSRG